VILDAIAALPRLERFRLAELLKNIAVTDPDEVRSAQPDSSLSLLYLFMHELQNELIGNPMTFAGHQIRRQIEGMGQAIRELAQRLEYVPASIAATLTALPLSSINRLCKQGTIRHRNPTGHGRRREIHVRDLIRWIDNRDKKRNS
jgi:hypothetical protein